VVVIVGGVVVAGDALMSLDAPVLPAVPAAPIEVPLPVEPLEAVGSVLVEPGVTVTLLLGEVPAVVSVGGVAGAAGVVLLEEDDVDDGVDESVAGRWPHADKARAAIRARAAQRAMGVVCIRTLLACVWRW
jgi:hypothetical protein